MFKCEFVWYWQALIDTFSEHAFTQSEVLSSVVCQSVLTRYLLTLEHVRIIAECDKLCIYACVHVCMCVCV
jgi:hypothetical protein